MKIGFFITARLKSSRLKQKILLNLNGKSILDRVIERCKAVKNVDGVVLCTSTNPQDSILYNNALNNKIQFYAGSEDDVLARLLSAAEYFRYDAFLSITADCPLFPIYLSQVMIDWYFQNEFSYIYISGLPKGMRPYVVDTNALRIANAIKMDTDTEIWGEYLNRPEYFKVGNLKIIDSPFKEDKRLTLDYYQDYELLRRIYSLLSDSYTPNIFDVMDILKKNPSLWNINRVCKHTQLNENKIKEINDAYFKKDVYANEFAKRINFGIQPGLSTLEMSLFKT